MNTTQLTCFLTVAETLNFAKAAQQLNITQPAVTQQIRSLEAELNFKLFNRTTRTVELTRAGLFFINDAKNVIQILEGAKKRGADSFEDTRVKFVIGCHAHNEIRQFAQVLQEMHNLFPDIYPIFQVIPFRHIYQQLMEESLDVIVTFQDKGLKKYFKYAELAKIPIMAVTSANHPLAKKSAVQMEELKKETLIVMEPWKCPDALRQVQHQAIEDRSILDFFLCDSAETAVTLSIGGYGTAIIPKNIPIHDPSLACIPIKDGEPISYGVYYKKLAGQPRLKTFINLAKDDFSSAFS